MTGEQEQEYLAYVSARTTWLRRVAYLLTHDWDSADELVQATITRLFVQWRRVRHADDVDAYVRRMLLNIWPCAGGRRKLWMRRTTVTASTTGAAVLAVVIGVASLPLSAPGTVVETLPALASPSAPVEKPPPPAPTRCTREPLELPARASGGSVRAGEPSGRYAVGVVDLDGQEVPVLWDSGRPIVVGKPKPGHLVAIDVNSSGTVVLAVQNESGLVSWIYRGGAFTELPGGYTAVAINTRGDVAGAWLDDKGVHPPVIWPGGQPGNPRRLQGGDPGDGIVAAVSDIDDDGTVVGATASMARYDNATPPPREAPSRPVYWPGATGSARDLPTPAGFGQAGWALSVRSGLATGHVARINPDADRRGNRAVIWDLAAGTATVEDRLSYAGDINTHGWVVGRTSAAPPAPPAALFGGNVVLLPMPRLGPDTGGAVGISDDGRTVYGTAADGNHAPVRWICT